MLIVKITKAGCVKYYGCASIETVNLGEGDRRMKMISSTGTKRIADLAQSDTVELMNDRIFL